MQGFVNRALQCFVSDTYGWPVWRRAIARTELKYSNFEAMLDYPPHVTQRIVEALEDEFSKPRSVILEDLGIYLVTNPANDTLRRMLRFGGHDFEDFILSLDELPERVRLALSDIALPMISVRPLAPKNYSIEIGDTLPGFSWTLAGVLRALADDYGALAFIELEAKPGGDTISVVLAHEKFAQGRQFELAPPRHAAY